MQPTDSQSHQVNAVHTVRGHRLLSRWRSNPVARRSLRSSYLELLAAAALATRAALAALHISASAARCACACSSAASRAACCVLMCSRAASIDASDTAKLASLPRCKHASEVERRPQTVEQVTRSVFSKEKCVPSKAAARAIAAASSARCCDPPRSCHQVAACSRPGLHSSAVGTKYRQLTRSNAKLTRRSPLAEVWACMMIGCVS